MIIAVRYSFYSGGSEGILPAMIEIIRTNDPTLITFAQALLAGEGIDCFVLDVHMSVLEGTIGMLPKRVMVGEKDAFLARSVLADNDIELVSPA